MTDVTNGGSLYGAFGLTFRSEIELPELLSVNGTGSADVDIRLRRIDHERPASRTTYIYGADHFLYWPAVGGFMIHGGRGIDIDPIANASEGLVRLPLLGPVMALLLHVRGALVLHASAVRIGERVAVFVGDKGAGKSTTAAAALKRGHELYTDDILAVECVAGARPCAAPGYPAIKLESDPSGRFLAAARRLAEPIAGFPKHIARLDAGYSDTTVPLGRIYVLTRGTKAEATRLGAADALKAVMRFAYAPLFQGKPWSREETQRLLTHSAALADAIGVVRLETPSTLDALDDVITCIETDLRT